MERDVAAIVVVVVIMIVHEESFVREMGATSRLGR